MPMAKELLDDGKKLLKLAKGTPRWTVYFTQELKRELKRVPEKDEEEPELMRRVATLLFIEQMLVLIIDVKHAMFPNGKEGIKTSCFKSAKMSLYITV